jgi:antitoxin (DNA-binding transcriptional repressor) of toxin-antitoxin stability system
VVVTRHAKPVAKIVPVEEELGPRVPGAWKGKIVAPEGWDEFTDEDERDWYGGPVPQELLDAARRQLTQERAS